jgi:translation initiation factor 1A
MPPKKKGGKKIRRGKSNVDADKRQLLFKEDGQEYGLVKDILGDCRVNVIDTSNVEHLGIIRGKMKKRVWINKGDLVLFGTREFQDDKVDIIHKYFDAEKRRLIELDEIPATFNITIIGNEEIKPDSNEVVVEFNDEIDYDEI